MRCAIVPGADPGLILPLTRGNRQRGALIAVAAVGAGSAGAGARGWQGSLPPGQAPRDLRSRAVMHRNDNPRGVPAPFAEDRVSREPHRQVENHQNSESVPSAIRAAPPISRGMRPTPALRPAAPMLQTPHAPGLFECPVWV